MNRRRVMSWMVVLSLLVILAAVVGGGIVRAKGRAAQSAEDLSESGIVIAFVAPDGPVDRAGVVRGDILLQVDDQTIDHTGDLLRYLGELEVGDEVELTVLHGDDQRILAATLGERDGQPYLGLTPCGGLPKVPEVRVAPMLSGALITEVVPDSPAEQAGLQEGDRIISVDGEALSSEQDLADLITAYAPGTTVRLEIERPDEETFEVTVELAQHPDQEGVAFLGVQYLPFPHLERFEWDGQPFDLPSPDREPFFIPPEGDLKQGAVVRDVAEGSPAAEVGLQEGDVITAIEDEPVEGPQDLVDAVAEREPGAQVTLTVWRPDEEEEQEVEVTLAEHPEQEGKAYLGVTIGAFIRIHHSEDELLPEGLRPFQHFDFDELPFDWGWGNGGQPGHFRFNIQPDQLWRQLPFGQGSGSPRFEFEGEPCCSGDDIL